MASGQPTGTSRAGDRAARPPVSRPYALPPVERLANTMEYFVHHEDLRRAQPGWEPRGLARRDQSRLWAALRPSGAGWCARPACRSRSRRSRHRRDRDRCAAAPTRWS